MLGLKIFCDRKILDPKTKLPKNIFGQKKCWVQKYWVKNYLLSKKNIESKIIFVNTNVWSKNILCTGKWWVRKMFLSK